MNCFILFRAGLVCLRDLQGDGGDFQGVLAGLLLDGHVEPLAGIECLGLASSQVLLQPFLQLLLLPVVPQSLVQLASLATVSAAFLAADLERNQLRFHPPITSQDVVSLVRLIR